MLPTSLQVSTASSASRAESRRVVMNCRSSTILLLYRHHAVFRGHQFMPLSTVKLHVPLCSVYSMQHLRSQQVMYLCKHVRPPPPRPKQQQKACLVLPVRDLLDEIISNLLWHVDNLLSGCGTSTNRRGLVHSLLNPNCCTLLSGPERQRKLAMPAALATKDLSLHLCLGCSLSLSVSVSCSLACLPAWRVRIRGNMTPAPLRMSATPKSVSKSCLLACGGAWELGHGSPLPCTQRCGTVRVW